MKFIQHSIILSGLIIVFASCGALSQKQMPRAQAGRLDLRNWDFTGDGMLPLNGKWAFFPEKLALADPRETENPTGFIQVPGNWNDFEWAGRSMGGHGYGTYRLRVLLPENSAGLALKVQTAATAYTLRANGKKILQSGIVGKSKYTTDPRYIPALSPIPDPGNELLITMEVANFAHHKGGLGTPIYLGKHEELKEIRQFRFKTYVFLAGALIIMAFYHFGLFSLRPDEKSTLFFGLFCILIVIRMVFSGERILVVSFPGIPFEVVSKFEYLSLYLAGPVFAVFLRLLFPHEVGRRIVQGALVIFGLLSALVLLTPTSVFSYTMLPVEILYTLGGLWLVYAVVLAVYRRRRGAQATLLGFSILLLAMLNDVLYSQNIIQTGFWTAYGLFAFVLSQSYMLSMRLSEAFKAMEDLSSKLSHTNHAYNKFVPHQFLSLLNKKNINEVRLGDQVQRDMTILFADIRSFRKLSRDMSPGDNFNFLNSYLGRVSPIIERNGGFIDKYIGDSIMALFPGAPDDALRAAIAMQKEIGAFNGYRMESGRMPIEVGIGIHTGSLMLGIIGGEKRMEPTVISDAVNLASRIKQLTKTARGSILISSHTLVELNDPVEFKYRRLGKLRIKGKRDQVAVFQILNAYPPEQLELFQETLRDFEDGVAMMQENHLDHARRAFRLVMDKNPIDESAVAFYRSGAKIFGIREKVPV